MYVIPIKLTTRIIFIFTRQSLTMNYLKCKRFQWIYLTKMKKM